MVHSPTATRVAILPDTVHTDVVGEVKVTGSLGPAVAVSVNGGVPNGLAALATHWPSSRLIEIWIDIISEC
jgi:hypothetical protein